MKTFEELYDERYLRLKGVWTIKDIRKMAAQAYARMVAQQALDDAAENLIEWSHEKHPRFSTVKKAIVSTRIFTP